MKPSWPVHAFVVFCVVLWPARAPSQTDPVAIAVAAAGSAEATVPPNVTSAVRFDDADIPREIQEIIGAAQSKYQEGSNFIKAGDSARARSAFDASVDLILQSDYDLNSVPALDRFFQDLIHRIEQDESRYLRPQELSDEAPEGAVVDELEKVDLIPIKVDPSLQDVAAADLTNAQYDIPVVLNEKVLKSLNFWLTRGRKLFIDGLMRSGRYRDMIEQVFREHSIPPDVMYLAQAESLFKPNAVSRARARGIWQFGKGTALRYGLKVNSYVDERSDPEKATKAAACYLSDLFAMFKDWNLVLAAYNWGEGKVQRLMERRGLKDFWEMTDLRRGSLPAETKNHVPLIMASIILAHNPEKYGLPRQLDSPEDSVKLAVAKPIDLRAVARILNITLEELKRLNPALKGLSTPADYPSFQLKVPTGADPEISQQIAELPEVKFKPPEENAARYKVQRGNTLSGIAARHHVTVTALVRANPGVSAKTLQIGRWIRIPESQRVGAGWSSGTARVSAARSSGSTANSPGKTRQVQAARSGSPHITTSVAKAKPSAAKGPAPKQIASK